MGGADAVDIQLFHQLQLREDLLVRHAPAVYRVGIVAIDTEQSDRNTVNEQLSCLIQGNFSQSHLLGDDLPTAFKPQGVEIRHFCIPKLRLFHSKHSLVFRLLGLQYPIVLQKGDGSRTFKGGSNDSTLCGDVDIP